MCMCFFFVFFSVVQKFSEGRSGSFFYFTHDSKFVVKTLVESEARYFIKILPDYVDHIVNNESTLVNKFLG